MVTTKSTKKKGEKISQHILNNSEMETITSQNVIFIKEILSNSKDSERYTFFMKWCTWNSAIRQLHLTDSAVQWSRSVWGTDLHIVVTAWEQRLFLQIAEVMEDGYFGSAVSKLKAIIIQLVLWVRKWVIAWVKRCANACKTCMHVLLKDFVYAWMHSIVNVELCI